MKEKLKGLIIGVMVGMCVASGSVMAVSGTMTKEITYRDIKITLDGERLRPEDANGNYVEPFIIDGTTYLPVRAVAEALDLDVEWNNRTSTVKLTTNDDNYYDKDDEYYEDIDYYDSIYDILTGDETYIDFETGETVTIDTMADVNENYDGVANKYCFIDLDDDSVEEVVVEFTRDGGYAVFNYDEDDDEWYCHYASCEEVIDLKQDGTMRWEESDEVFGTQKFMFTNGGMKRYTMIYINDEDGEYSICDIPVTRNNCTIDINEHDDKRNARFKSIDNLD